MADSNYENLLAGFEPINLKGLDSVRLLNRKDTKFVLRKNQLAPLLEALYKEYFILEINGDRLMDYESLYYDTARKDLYLKHHNKRKNRFKLRFRKYVSSDLTFFEIKKKNNKGRTIKKRMVTADIQEQLQSDTNDFFKQEMKQSPDELQPSLWIYFKRFTLTDKKFSERATIDVALSYSADGKLVEMDNLVIAEIKQPSYLSTSVFVRTLSNLGIKPFRISKYCLGMHSCYADLKYNNFKSKFNRIKKLTA